jgi:peptidoglycan/xylan/chitin deacetylase (PgdA/CDA1 family)
VRRPGPVDERSQAGRAGLNLAQYLSRSHHERLGRRRRADQPPLPGPDAVRARARAAGGQADHAERVRPDGVLEGVTLDDGLVKDPRFIRMVKDFQIPITIDLANLFISDDYKYFEKLHETGYVSIQNHTVNHPLNMPGLSASQQLDEISGQQEILHRRYGVRPYIFRPPGGNYDETTITSAGRAGLKGVMLWKEAMEVTDMEYQTSVHRLNPGDIILGHFRGPAQLHGETMVHMMIRLYKHIQAQGFTVADITKYV